MINVTADAANKLKEYISLGLPEGGSSLRIRVVGGGCSGLRYELAFDNTINRDSDFVEEAHGVKVIIDEKSALYMVGTELDFVDSLMESGFKISNPNARNSCGCGESFAV